MKKKVKTTPNTIKGTMFSTHLKGRWLLDINVGSAKSKGSVENSSLLIVWGY